MISAPTGAAIVSAKRTGGVQAEPLIAQSSSSVRGRAMLAPTQMYQTRNIQRQNAPIEGSVPLTGRQPESEYYQSPRSDARRTSCSRGRAALHLQACPRIPRRGHAAGITEKGVQNRRFWCVFGYFCHKTKVTAGPGCASPGHRARNNSPAAGGGRNHAGQAAKNSKGPLRLGEVPRKKSNYLWSTEYICLMSSSTLLE